MTAQEDNTITSPALITLAVRVRSEFNKLAQSLVPHSGQKVIVKAEEVGKIYHSNRETLTAAELEVLYEILREFGIITVHVSPEFHTHVANVIKFLERNDKTVTKSHVAGLIFSRM